MPSQGKSPLESLFQKVDDCERPACEETVSALSQALSRISAEKTKTAGKTAASVKDGVSSSSSPSSSPTSSLSCPPTKDVIGKSSWTLLHSMAAWYPERPTMDEKNQDGAVDGGNLGKLYYLRKLIMIICTPKQIIRCDFLKK